VNGGATLACEDERVVSTVKEVATREPGFESHRSLSIHDSPISEIRISREICG